ncbi:MAG: sensor histidine kinase [Roseateles sp.]|uniref:sensor histidine kinase n=1 Tax=Roseateles sp. TaxID=1971397 RepID=UPI004035EE9C
MKDSRILSSFQELAHAAGARPIADMPEDLRARVQVFDTCQVGTVLRAVLFVQAIVAVAALFGAQTFIAWVTQLAIYTGAALPAVLAWLLTVCGLKRQLGLLPIPGQWAAAVGFGALSGLYGCGLLVWMGLVEPSPWLASAASGALVSAVLVAALMWRSKARGPAGATARLAELQARIRPHFLFNTLNSAIALVQVDPARAESVLEDLAELFRVALADASASVTLTEEVELARRYLAIEQIRFGKRLRIVWHLDPEADAARVPPLLLQPLVENAVRHGVEPNEEGGELEVSTMRRGAEVEIRIVNTVGAPARTAGHGLALRNVRQRLKLMHDVAARFELESTEQRFALRILVPL